MGSVGGCCGLVSEEIWYVFYVLTACLQVGFPGVRGEKVFSIKFFLNKRDVADAV